MPLIPLNVTALTEVTHPPAAKPVRIHPLRIARVVSGHLAWPTAWTAELALGEELSRAPVCSLLAALAQGQEGKQHAPKQRQLQPYAPEIPVSTQQRLMESAERVQCPRHSAAEGNMSEEALQQIILIASSLCTTHTVPPKHVQIWVCRAAHLAVCTAVLGCGGA